MRSVKDEVRVRVENRAWFWFGDRVWASTRDQVWDEVWDEVQERVEDEVRDNVLGRVEKEA